MRSSPLLSEPSLCGSAFLLRLTLGLGSAFSLAGGAGWAPSSSLENTQAAFWGALETVALEAALEPLGPGLGLVRASRMDGCLVSFS